MQITKEFLEAEIADMEQERRRAYEFTIKATAAIDVHKMLLARLEAPETEIPSTDSQT